MNVRLRESWVTGMGPCRAHPRFILRSESPPPGVGDGRAAGRSTRAPVRLQTGRASNPKLQVGSLPRVRSQTVAAKVNAREVGKLLANPSPLFGAQRAGSLADAAVAEGSVPALQKPRVDRADVAKSQER
jgi:hypothetical protein